MTIDFFFTKSARKVTKSAKNATKNLKSAKTSRKVSNRRDFIVLVLLSAHAERVGVFRMQDGFCKNVLSYMFLTLQSCYHT